jgi:zeaxanthin glucosyltransferase
MSRDTTAPARRSWHLGMLSFTGTGHLNPLLALAQELTHRGHRVTFFERSKIRDRVLKAGLEFVPVCDDRFRRPVRPILRRPGVGSEIRLLRFRLKRILYDLEHYLRETPPALARAGIDALLVNEIALTGPTLAQQLDLPYFVISTSVPHNLGWRAFPWFSGYRASSALYGIDRAFLEVSALRVRGPIRWALDRYRKSRGLGSLRRLMNMYPPLAHITQLPQSLDLPNIPLPKNFCYTGPFVDRQTRPPVNFPWEKLDGRPLIYASLGTTEKVQLAIFRLIAKACQSLEVQLVISLGAQFSPDQLSDLPGKPLVVGFAPQLELLRRATLVITHAGPNTVFETLLEGKPMVAIPIALDQPAIARRLARVGAAQVLPVMHLSIRRMRAAIVTVLQEPSYRLAALALQEKLRSVHGAEKAADIIEDALRRHAADQRAQIRSDSAVVPGPAAELSRNLMPSA